MVVILTPTVFHGGWNPRVFVPKKKRERRVRLLNESFWSANFPDSDLSRRDIPTTLQPPNLGRRRKRRPVTPTAHLAPRGVKWWSRHVAAARPRRLKCGEDAAKGGGFGGFWWWAVVSGNCWGSSLGNLTWWENTHPSFQVNLTSHPLIYESFLLSPLKVYFHHAPGLFDSLE